MTIKSAKIGLAKAYRIIHHFQKLYPLVRGGGTHLGARALGNTAYTSAGRGHEGWEMADRSRKHPAWQDAGDLRIRQDRKRSGGLRQSVWHEPAGVGARSIIAPRPPGRLSDGQQQI